MSGSSPTGAGRTPRRPDAADLARRRPADQRDASHDRTRARDTPDRVIQQRLAARDPDAPERTAVARHRPAAGVRKPGPRSGRRVAAASCSSLKKAPRSSPASSSRPCRQRVHRSFDDNLADESRFSCPALTTTLRTSLAAPPHGTASGRPPVRRSRTCRRGWSRTRCRARRTRRRAPHRRPRARASAPGGATPIRSAPVTTNCTSM